MKIPRPILNLIEYFERLPGIGPKTAQRLTFFLLHFPKEDLERFGSDKAYVIGGSRVYEEAMPLSNFLEITRVHREVEGDIYFPNIDWNKWSEISREDKKDFSFISYGRK